MDAIKLSNAFEKVMDSRFVLYGALTGGKNCFGYMKNLGLEDQIVGFVDSNPKKQGTQWCGRDVWSVEFIKEHPDLVVIVSSGFFGDILKTIRTAGCANLVYAYTPFRPLYELEETFAVDAEYIGSFYDLSDELTKSTIKALTYVRDSSNYKIQPIDDVMCVQMTPSYWCYDKASLEPYEALTICDAGAFDGDTLKQLFAAYADRIKKYYAFEPDEETFPSLVETISSMKLEKIVYPLQFGLSDKDELLRFSTDGIPLEHHISECGDAEISVKKLDSFKIDVEGKLCIKMDIEGFEMEALKGARSVIERYEPNLAICIYHKQNDVFKVPEYIKSINPKYNCVIRGGLHMVCYAACAG
jgi:FkbM family methyltransferase